MKACVVAWMKEQMPDSDEGTLKEIYDEYKTTAANLLQQWKSALANHEDEKAVDVIVHTLKGNAAMVGDAEISQLAQHWREACKAKEQQKCEEILQKLEGLIGLL